VPGPVCRYYLPRLDGRSHVLIGQWTTATLRMTCLTGGLTPCSAATGIPGRPATSSSPTCRARAALTKAVPGTPWSSARQTAAVQPGTARDTTRPTRRPPAPLGSQAVGRPAHCVGRPQLKRTELFGCRFAVLSDQASASGGWPSLPPRMPRSRRRRSLPCGLRDSVGRHTRRGTTSWSLLPLR